MKEEDNIIGERIKAARREKNYSQSELAAIMRISDYQIISQYESGFRKPGRKRIKELASALNTSQAYLLGEPPDVEELPLHHPKPLDDDIEKNIPVGGLALPEPTEEELIRSRTKPLPATKSDIAWIAGKLTRITGRLSHIEKSIDRHLAPPSNVIQFPRPSRPWNPDVCLDIAVGAGEVCMLGDEAYSEGYVSVELPDQADWVLGVKGSSMEPEIADGALLFVRAPKLGEVKEGDICTCYLIDEKVAIVRRIFFHEKAGVVEIGLQRNKPRETKWYTWDEDTIKINALVVGWTKTEEEKRDILARIIKRES